MHPYCACSQGHVMGTCTCGMYFHGETGSNSYFSVPNYQQYHDYDPHDDIYSFTPSSTSVDCTLSLGTPSTRLTQHDDKPTRRDRRSSVTNFCWDLLHSKHNHRSQTKPNVPTNANGNGNNDPLSARRCANCDTTSTPLWRNGPRGPKSLCNACGIRFKKEERRASAAAAATTTTAPGGVMESSHGYGHHNDSWYAHSNEFHFVDDSDNTENGIPFLSWRLNVADKTSFVHDFTR